MQRTTIGTTARAAGVSVETVRFYERKGLIQRPPKPATGGYRSYPPEAVRRIRFVRQAQELGFSLSDIHELLDLRADPSSDCSDVRDRAREKLDDVEQKMARLGRIRETLEDLVAICPGNGGLGGCPILRSIDALEPDGTGGASARTLKETRP